MSEKKMKIAIIGSGASGLVAVKSCLDEGLDPVCFERTDDIGGLWRYTDKVTEGQACVMKSTIINTSKEMMCYSDFPIPDDYPVFMHNTYVQKYFNLYADKFGLRKYIKFKTEIAYVAKHPDFKQNGKWILEVKDNNTGSTEEMEFDAVMVCTGHHAEKHIPEFPGLSNFKGKVLHSHDYRHPAGYENKRVVIIGIGNSGGDMAVELSRVASQVFISTRRGSWVLNRIADSGMPVDMINSRRFMLELLKFFPKLASGFIEYQLNKRFDHATYGLKPKHPVFAQHPMVNDEMPNRIASGTLKVKSDIAGFTETGVLFDDGTQEDDIDIVVLATGYKFGFPFIDKSVVDVQENRVQLFKYVFPPKLEKHTLSVIGCVQPLGAIMPISELQCRLSTRVFQGKVKLPDASEMMADIKLKEEMMKRRYTQSQRHTIQVDFINYMDQLAELNCSLPDFKSIIWSDPKLAFTCYFGPCTPYQYRLSGPGKWKGARKAIMSQWDRTLAPLKTRPLGFKETKSQFKFFLFYAVFVVVFCCIVHFIFSIF